MARARARRRRGGPVRSPPRATGRRRSASSRTMMSGTLATVSPSTASARYSSPTSTRATAHGDVPPPEPAGARGRRRCVSRSGCSRSRSRSTAGRRARARRRGPPRVAGDAEHGDPVAVPDPLGGDRFAGLGLQHADQVRRRDDHLALAPREQVLVLEVQLQPALADSSRPPAPGRAGTRRWCAARRRSPCRKQPDAVDYGGAAATGSPWARAPCGPRRPGFRQGEGAGDQSGGELAPHITCRRRHRAALRRDAPVRSVRPTAPDAASITRVLPLSSATAIGVAGTPTRVGSTICASGNARPIASPSTTGSPGSAAAMNGVIELSPPISIGTRWVGATPRNASSARSAVTSSVPAGSFRRRRRRAHRRDRDDGASAGPRRCRRP